MRINFTGLWLHLDFRKLWIGQAASRLATELAMIVIPLTAVVVLNASPIQMGVIGAMSGAPALIGIFLGVWADRRRRGPILVAADAGRMLLLLSIPVAHVFDVLSIELLYAVSAGFGALTMLFEIAYRSFLPSVVSRGQLMEANSKLELATSGSVALGPGIGGVLAQIVTAPFAMIFAIVTYAASTLMFRSMRIDEADPVLAIRPDGRSESMMRGIRQGLSFFRRNQTLLGITAAGSSLVFFGAAYDAIYILYMIRELEFTAAMVGLLFSLGSLGLLGGAFISSWLTKRIGIGRSLSFGFLVMGAAAYVVPLAGGPIALAYSVVVFAEISFLLGLVIWNIGQVSLRQATTPDRLLGRVTSFIVVGARAAIPPGALLGGYLGEFIGLRESMFVFATGISLSLIWLIYFRVWNIRDIPDATEIPAEVPAGIE